MGITNAALDIHGWIFELKRFAASWKCEREKGGGGLKIGAMRKLNPAVFFSRLASVKLSLSLAFYGPAIIFYRFLPSFT